MTRFVLLPILLAASAGVEAQPATTAPGNGFEVERYTVSLQPDLATTAVAGAETIVVRGTSDGATQLAFTANALRISDATVDGSPVQVLSNKDAIVFTLPHSLRKGGRATLRFCIDGTPARGVTAGAGGSTPATLHATGWCAFRTLRATRRIWRSTCFCPPG